MTHRTRPTAGHTPPVTRILRAFINHAGAATEDQIVTDLGNLPAATVARHLEGLRQTGMVADTGARRLGWGRRSRTLWAITDKGRARAAELDGARRWRSSRSTPTCAPHAVTGRRSR